jgi:hypothetical protein
LRNLCIIPREDTLTEPEIECPGELFTRKSETISQTQSPLLLLLLLLLLLFLPRRP